LSKIIGIINKIEPKCKNVYAQYRRLKFRELDQIDKTEKN